MTPRESTTLKTITRHLERHHGAYVVKTHGDAKRAGQPDLLCCVYGLFVAIEVKAPGASRGATRRQLAELSKIKRSHGIAFVARCTEDVDNIVALIRQRERLR